MPNTCTIHLWGGRIMSHAQCSDIHVIYDKVQCGILQDHLSVG